MRVAEPPAAPIAEPSESAPTTRAMPNPPHQPAPSSQEIVNHPLVRKAVELFADRTPAR